MPAFARMSPESRKGIWAELGIVLGLSLGASAIYSILSLIAKLTSPAGLAGSKTVINQTASDRVWLDVSYQLADVLLGLAPVALVLYLGWRNYGSQLKAAFGIAADLSWRKQSLRGLALAAAIGIPGLGLYLAARALGLSAQVVPTNQHAQWWTLLLLVLFAAKAALTEELIAIGYLFDRLAAVGLTPRLIVVLSALLRASYHLYQGFAGFVGNLAMGLVFGFVFLRLRNKVGSSGGALWPLIIAHFAIDVTVFAGYSLLDLNGILN